MARALVEIDDPLGISSPVGGTGALASVGTSEEGRALPMLLGAFVRVEVAAGEAQGLVEIPRTALRDGDVVWVVDDGRLRIRPVEVAWRLRDAVLVSRGVEDGEPVIVSPLSSPPEGLAVRVIDDARPRSGGGPTAEAAAAPRPGVTAAARGTP
jgi:hypothetical protein